MSYFDISLIVDHPFGSAGDERDWDDHDDDA
jgi:hypothetical protein